jgi:lipoate-protein ligase A
MCLATRGSEILYPGGIAEHSRERSKQISEAIMKVCELSFPNPAENLACDEALLEMCEEGLLGDVLRFWESSQYFVVVGYGNDIHTEVNLAYCEEQRIPVLRRCSGGGTVLQGPGCLNYSLVLTISDSDSLQSVSATNRFVMERHQAALANLVGKPVKVEGCTDLAIDGLKFSGNAQRRRKDHLLFHGTFLLDFDIRLIEKALHLPSKQPGYRAKRSHTDFLMNLAVGPASVKNALIKAWDGSGEINHMPSDRISRLVSQKYGRTEWNLKQETR